jgi:hypothetical protein
VKHIVLDDCGLARFCEDLPAVDHTFWLAVLGEYWKTIHAYRDDGAKFRPRVDLSALPPRTRWRSFLARTIYNPIVKVPVAYERVGEYSIGEIKEKILSYLPRDDDILTQFLTRDEIRRLLAQADSFDDLAEAVRAIEGQHELDARLERKLQSMGVLGEDER